VTAHPEGGFDILGLPAQWDGREPYVSPSGSSADGVLPCGRLGCFADFTGSCCIYCGKETP
jgi:hypothetical protein